MKRLLYIASIALCCIRCTTIHPLSLDNLPIPPLDSNEKTERFWYSERQELWQMLCAIRDSTPYSKMYVNGARFTEMADTPTFRHSILVAELKPSQTKLVIKPCPCPPDPIQPIPVKAL